MRNIWTELEETKSRAERRLASTGSAKDVKVDVELMAKLPLPLATKYQRIHAEALVRDNSIGDKAEQDYPLLKKLSMALSILEKYGLNLTNPTRPQYWRSIKHNNPVFKANVDFVKGGRDVLHLYGYTHQQADGMYFPEDVADPDVSTVAMVTVEVMTLRVELDMFLEGCHPRQEIFLHTVNPTSQQEAADDQEYYGVVSDAVVIPSQIDDPTAVRSPSSSSPVLPSSERKLLSSPAQNVVAVARCNLCGNSPSVICPSCGSLPFCEQCDQIYHHHPDRTAHQRERAAPPGQDTCLFCGVVPVSAHCPTCEHSLCTQCDLRYHSHPERIGHVRTDATPAVLPALSLAISSWVCGQCSERNDTQARHCSVCKQPKPSPAADWKCKSCTFENASTSVLCGVCERPRLATRPSLLPTKSFTRSPDTEWACQRCTFDNASSSVVCTMCDLPRDAPVFKPLPQPPVNKAANAKVEKPNADAHRQNADLQRQRLMREQGLKLIQHIREGESKGLRAEEVYAALCVSKGSDINPCDWLNLELPHVLDQICTMAASVQQDHGIVQVSRAEAKQAWVWAQGDCERAFGRVLRDRRAKMHELALLGFKDVTRCDEALKLSGGDVQAALSLLQGPLLEAFHQRVWSPQPPPEINVHDPDKQRTCRRLLALYGVPSWGRCELALSLLQEPDTQYTLEDVVDAVRTTHDRDLIRRILAIDCPICLESYPHSKMLSLTSCQCSVCCECFQEHFTVAVRDKHIRDMVCPVCGEPDINNPEHLDSYFSMLIMQLKECLQLEVLDLFQKKLTEHTLLKDPKFLWCCHCSYGFIYERDQLKVTCTQCRKSFCCQCKKAWEDQHESLTCEQFQTWKRENDPEYQRQGLAGFLRDNGIKCPSCRFQYALAKGGCIHFTCSQCRYQFCSGCNNPFHTTACNVVGCNVTGLHAHHPRDCLFYLRDWTPARLQELLQKNSVEFNINSPAGTEPGVCSVMEQKEDADQHKDLPCGTRCEAGQAGLCEKHYKEYLVSLINSHRLDPAPLFQENELPAACKRYQVYEAQGEGEDDVLYHSRLLKKLMEEVPLGDKVPRNT